MIFCGWTCPAQTVIIIKTAILEDKAFVFDVTPGNVPVFRMSDDFVELLRRRGKYACPPGLYSGLSMSSDERQLDELLARFDTQTCPFDESEFVDKIQSLARNRGDVQELTPRELAEGMAFSFATTPEELPSPWGTHYGPRSWGTSQDGRSVESPSIDKVSSAMIEYWVLRVDSTSNPSMRARYADLVFDFGERITRKKPDYRMAHVVIDETVKLVECQQFRFMLEVRVKLARALDLAIRMHDPRRVARVSHTIIKCEQSSAKDHSNAA